MYQARIERILGAMKEAGLAQLLVSDPKSIYYLTGVENNPFERFWALLLREDGAHVLFSNRLFNVPPMPMKVVTLDDTDVVADHVAPELLAGTLGIDKTLAARFLLPLMEKAPKVKMVLGSDCVDDCRACKDEAEKQLMRRASEINDICIEKLVAFIHEGVTEKECVDYLLSCYAEYGCEGVSFEPIVSFGPNAADPHHSADGTVIKEGDCIVIDIGCKKDRYCSDMTRTYFWKKADPKYLAIHDLVREANEKAEAMVREGVRLCDVDACARDMIAAAGYGEYFTHRLGHFIGMEDHEKGDVSCVNQNTAKVDNIFSIEPGVYLPGEFGVRVEDLLIVTKDGCELLNRVDKHAKILGV